MLLKWRDKMHQQWVKDFQNLQIWSLVIPVTLKQLSSNITYNNVLRWAKLGWYDTTIMVDVIKKPSTNEVSQARGQNEIQNFDFFPSLHRAS